MSSHSYHDPSDHTRDLRDDLAAPVELSGIHPLSTAHLVMGVGFLTLAAAWVLAAAGVLGGGDLRWVLPLPFVLGGATGLVALGLAARNRRPADG